jgi:hypothetical protein
MLTVCVTVISIQEICILSTEGVPVAFIELRWRGDFLDMQHAQIGGCYNRDRVFIVG